MINRHYAKFYSIIVIFIVTQYAMLFTSQGPSKVVTSLSSGDISWKRTQGQLTITDKDKDSNSRSLQMFSWKNYTSNNSRIVSTETFIYAPFTIPEPKFISERCRNLFYKFNKSVEFVGTPSDDKLVGRIFNVTNGTYQLPHDCGYKSDVGFALERRYVASSMWYPALVPIIVPDGHTFQHFLDGTLPKIIQALHVIQMPNVKILIWRPRDKIIHKFLWKLNITDDKIAYYNGGIVGADRLIFACNTPPIHPVLWKRARSLLGVPETLPVRWKEGKIVMITRTGCLNCGRQLLNQADLVDMLTNRYGKEAVNLYKGPSSLEDSIKLFGNARVVIGTHGGGMYTLNFCPRATTIIEFMPTHEDGSVIAAAFNIIWAQAILLEQDFWRIATIPQNGEGDLIVNVTMVEDILDVVDKQKINKMKTTTF